MKWVYIYISCLQFCFTIQLSFPLHVQVGIDSSQLIYMCVISTVWRDQSASLILYIVLNSDTCTYSMHVCVYILCNICTQCVPVWECNQWGSISQLGICCSPSWVCCQVNLRNFALLTGISIYVCDMKHDLFLYKHRFCEMLTQVVGICCQHVTYNPANLKVVMVAVSARKNLKLFLSTN